MPSTPNPSNPPAHDVELEVHGEVPRALAGRVLGIDREGTLHRVEVRLGRLRYRSRALGTDVVLDRVVAFGDSLLAVGDGAPAFELTAQLDGAHRVDLAGHGRVLVGQPAHDPASGELHLVARDAGGAHAHVVVSAGALTRRSRPLLDVPGAIRELVVAHDHLVLLAEGFVGIASRDGEARVVWTATSVAVARPTHTDTGEGWLIGFVDVGGVEAAGVTQLQVHAAADPNGVPVASAPIPSPIAAGMRCTWVAAR